jgi:plastocyanin
VKRFLSLRGAIAVALLVGVLVTASLVRAATAPESAVTVDVSAGVAELAPRVILAQPHQPVVFTNETTHDLQLTTTPHHPAAFQLTVPSGGSARLTLTTPGLYHYYDAATAHVIDYAAETDVVHARSGAPHPSLPDDGWIVVPGPGGLPYDTFIHVPAANDLMAPHVTAIRVGGSVVIHNHDSDAHNLVTDPADPTGAAFELLGTDGEPALNGAERRITFTKPGLYHVYCSIHARIVGKVGPWQVVTPRDSAATGYPEGNPMEAWILVTP